MRNQRKKLIVTAASLIVLVWGFLTVDMAVKLHTVKTGNADSVLLGLMEMRGSLNNESLHASEYGRMRTQTVGSTREALNEYAVVTNHWLSHIDSYIWLYHDFAYLVSEGLVTEEERESLRVRLQEYAMLTPEMSLSFEDIGASQCLEEVERALEELMDSSEEARQKYSELQYDMAVLKG